jgi:hypothetical protein
MGGPFASKVDPMKLRLLLRLILAQAGAIVAAGKELCENEKKLKKKIDNPIELQ